MQKSNLINLITKYVTKAFVLPRSTVDKNLSFLCDTESGTCFSFLVNEDGKVALADTDPSCPLRLTLDNAPMSIVYEIAVEVINDRMRQLIDNARQDDWMTEAEFVVGYRHLQEVVEDYLCLQIVSLEEVVNCAIYDALEKIPVGTEVEWNHLFDIPNPYIVYIDKSTGNSVEGIRDIESMKVISIERGQIVLEFKLCDGTDGLYFTKGVHDNVLTYRHFLYSDNGYLPQESLRSLEIIINNFCLNQERMKILDPFEKVASLLKKNADIIQCHSAPDPSMLLVTVDAYDVGFKDADGLEVNLYWDNLNRVEAEIGGASSDKYQEIREAILRPAPAESYQASFGTFKDNKWDVTPERWTQDRLPDCVYHIVEACLSAGYKPEKIFVEFYELPF